MRDLRPGSPFRQCLGWIAVALLWAGFTLWKWTELDSGAITDERFVLAISGPTLQVLLLIGFKAWEARKARRPKPPPVYHSTILD